MKQPVIRSYRALQLVVVIIQLTAVYSHTTTDKTTYTTATPVNVTQAEEDYNILMETARLHEFIRSRPTAQEKVAPVTTLGSGHQRTRAVLLNVDIYLADILSVDDAKQTMTTDVVFSISWQDRSLQWNANHYGGVERVELPLDSVWTPPIFVLNALGTTNIISSADFVHVHNTGLMDTMGLFQGETTCSMDLGEFPYDSQQCLFIIETISDSVILNTTYSLMAKAYSLALSKPDWEIMKIKNVNLQFNHEKPTQAVQVELRRHSTFYTVCLVVPMILTSYMNTMVFLVPLQSGEKISFLVSIFVSTSVFISFFTSVMPRGLQSVPTTMKLLIGVVVESFTVLLATLLVMRKFHSGLPDNPQPWSGAAPEESKETESPQEPDTKPAVTGRKAGLCGGLSNSLFRLVRMTTGAETGGQPSNTSGTVSDHRPGFCMTAQRLDRFFFVVFFFANSLFLCVLYFAL